MSPFIFLDSGPLGLITHPRQTDEVTAVTEWLARMLKTGNRVLVPAIIYYELKRELLRAKSRLVLDGSMFSAQHRIATFPSPMRPFTWRQNCGPRLDKKGDQQLIQKSSTSMSSSRRRPCHSVRQQAT